jgi:hypothetical protein
MKKIDLSKFALAQGPPPNSFAPTVDGAASHRLMSITFLSEAHYENGFFEVPRFSVLNGDMVSG